MNRKRDIQEQDKEKEEQVLNLKLLHSSRVQIVKAQCCLILSARNVDFIMEDKF